jgi:hypothetical protein
MKLISERLLDQLLTQVLPGCDHEREALGAPLLDTRLYPMRSEGIHDQGGSRYPGTWRAKPPQRVHKADPLHVDVLELG